MAIMNAVLSRQDHSLRGLNRPAAGPGEYVVQLPYAIRLAKPVTYIDGEVPKTNDLGQPLYKDNVTVDELGAEAWDEVTERQKPVAWEERTTTYLVDGENVTTTAQIPIEWEERAPVMVPHQVTSYVTFEEAPALFTYDEIVAAKIESIQAVHKGLDLVFYDEDFSLEHFADELQSHKANMGDGIMALHPGGSCRTVKLQLGKATDTIQLYLEAQPAVVVAVGAKSGEPFVDFVDGIAMLPEPADAVYVLFTNTTDRYRDVYAFGLLI
ncbi:hypothetical protein [Paenibacillus sp. YYML68]|uniref:hypothetical protein n=1 Tax=Paenibacillus sp. YYML68 TaxID=2909250 RepID=UPI00249356A0|nr:hypothetical protein [Paenibacillus sp. YYML68]